MASPLEARKFFGHALDFAQRGSKHDAATVLKGFGGAGVPHCFSKKSKRGIETRQEDMDIIRARLKVAEARSKELCHEQAIDDAYHQRHRR